MAPTKFGLFKARSRDSQDQPSTEYLLHTSCSSDQVATPQSPIPSTSKGITEYTAATEMSTLRLNSDEAAFSDVTYSDVDYQSLKSRDASSTPCKDQDLDDASTTYDAKSLQFDDSSVASSKDVPAYCRTSKKTKKINSKTARHLRDRNMWTASNVEVMQNLLRGCGTLDEQIKWEAIATARGLCTLTDSCMCSDCRERKFLAGMADGDGGLGAAPPLMGIFSLGCRLQ